MLDLLNKRPGRAASSDIRSARWDCKGHQFPDDFHSAITTLASSISDREQSYGQRLSATKGLEAEEKRGRLVLGVLDKLVRPALAGNDALLRGWEGARHIRRRTGPNAATAEVQTTTEAEAAATPSSAASTTSTTPTTPPVAAA